MSSSTKEIHVMPRLAPAGEILDKTQLARLRRRLVDNRRTKIDWIGAVDTSLVGAERVLAQALAARARESVELIEHALARIDAGTYGSCELCGQAVTVARLDAIPEARACMNCQDRHDAAM
jgi:RNA polymerase-binding transcription factor DksA